jgi:hypothetical protein
MKLVRLIKMCLTETYSRVHIGKYFFYSRGMHPVARVMKSQDKTSFTTSIVHAFYFMHFLSQHVSAFSISHPQVILHNTKNVEKEVVILLQRIR